MGKEARPSLHKNSALARPQHSDARDWSSEAIVCLWAWLVMAGCFVGLALHAASGHIARTDLRLLNASRHVPASMGRWFDLEMYLGTPQLLSVCVVALALVLFARRAWLEGIVTLSAFGLFAIVVLSLIHI